MSQKEEQHLSASEFAAEIDIANKQGRRIEERIAETLKTVFKEIEAEGGSMSPLIAVQSMLFQAMLMLVCAGVDTGNDRAEVERMWNTLTKNVASTIDATYKEVGESLAKPGTDEVTG